MLDWTSAGNGALLWGSTAPKRRQRTGTREWLALAGSGWCDDGVAYLGGPHGESQSSAGRHLHSLPKAAVLFDVALTTPATLLRHERGLLETHCSSSSSTVFHNQAKEFLPNLDGGQRVTGRVAVATKPPHSK